MIPARRLVSRAALLAVVAAVLVAVFLAYLKPDLALTLAQQLWACF